MTHRLCKGFCLCLLLTFPSVLPLLAGNVEAYKLLRVDDCKTSIYIGNVGMKMTPFALKDGRFEAGYQARVVPFLFYSESGSLDVEFSDEQLERLQKGERVEFVGLARNKEGEPRKVTGQATPEGPLEGRIKVRVWVSKNIQLIFNTRYHFAG